MLRRPLEPTLTWGEVAGHQGGHRGFRDPELGGDMDLRDSVLKVTSGYPQPASRGQRCVNVGHEQALLLWTICVETSIL